MGFKDFLIGVDHTAGVSRNVARVGNVLGASGAPAPGAPGAMVPARPSTLSSFLSELRSSAPQDVPDGIGTLVGATAGIFAWRNHRVLGGITGASIGRNIPALFNASHRGAALRNLVATGGGVTLALLLARPGSWVRPALGFVGGSVVGGVVSHFLGLH